MEMSEIRYTKYGIHTKYFLGITYAILIYNKNNFALKNSNIHDISYILRRDTDSRSRKWSHKHHICVIHAVFACIRVCDVYRMCMFIKDTFT